MKPPIPYEADIHITIVSWLIQAKIPEIVYHHSPNEGKRGPKAQRWLKKSGTRKGWFDFEFLYRAKWMGMEVKRPGEKLSPAQQTVHDEVAAAGFMVCVVHSLDEAQKELATFVKAARGDTPLYGRVA